MHARPYFKVIIITVSTCRQIRDGDCVADADKSKVPPDLTGVPPGTPFTVSGPTYIGQGHYEFVYTPVDIGYNYQVYIEIQQDGDTIGTAVSLSGGETVTIFNPLIARVPSAAFSTALLAIPSAIAGDAPTQPATEISAVAGAYDIAVAAGDTVYFFVQVRDQNGIELNMAGLALKVEVLPTKSVQDNAVTTTEVSAGLFRVSFVPIVVGKVNVFVSLNGAEISNSQFDCSIGASDSDATLSTIDDAAVSIAAGRAGLPSTFNVIARDTYGNLVRPDRYYPPRHPTYCEPSFLEYDCILRRGEHCLTGPSRPPCHPTQFEPVFLEFNGIL